MEHLTINEVKAQGRNGVLHMPLLTSRGGGPGRLTSKTMSISLADKQNGFISCKTSLTKYIESLRITMVQMTVGYASDGVWISANTIGRTLGGRDPSKPIKVVELSRLLVTWHVMGSWDKGLSAVHALGRFRRLRHSGSASYPDVSLRCARKGRREGFPWSLAVHHQSLAFRARLCHAKNKAPEEEAYFGWLYANKA